MKFCPKCGTLMRIDRKNKQWVCPSCGYKEKITDNDRERLIERHKVEHRENIIVVEDNIGNGNIARVKCPRCGNEMAFFTVMHIPVSDGEEEEIILYKCTKCGHTWREGDS